MTNVTQLRQPPATGPETPRIAVAFDGGAAAWAALRRAADLARATGGTVTVLHAASPTISSFDAARRAFRALEAAHARGGALLASAGRELGTAVPWTAELLHGDPASAVSARAEELGADVLVVGGTGRGALDRLLTGSVGETIVRRATLPVLVVPAQAALAA